MSLVDYDRCRGVKVNCKKRRASSFLTPHSSWLSHQIILEQCVSGWLLSWGTEQLLAAMPLLCINKTSVQFVQRLRYRVVNWKTFLVKTCGRIFEFDQWVLRNSSLFNNRADNCPKPTYYYKNQKWFKIPTQPLFSHSHVQRSMSNLVTKQVYLKNLRVI